MQKPTIEQISDYCFQRNNGIDPEAFFHFYESKSWLIGKSPMKSWKSAVITWEKRQPKRPNAVQTFINKHTSTDWAN